MKINKLPRKYLVLSFFLTLTYFSQAQNATINGTVTDINNKLLNGVNIAVLGTSKGVSTDNTGNYTINGLNQRTYFLQVSYLGYQTITKEVTLDTTEKAVDFVLYQTSDELSEVVVTANRRLQNIQKTAASVSAVNTKKIEQLQVQEIAELNAIAPNFRVYDDGGTGSFSIVASRGISTVDFNPTVGLYIDDIPYFTTFAFPLEFSDLDNIEVLRGPQGTLYGRNALAGVIKINTKKPTNELTGFVNIGAGNLNAIDLSAGFNLPIVKDKLFFRASTTVSNRDGFVKNTLLDKDLQNRKAVDANFRLKYLATDNLNFDLHYSIQRRESDAYAFVLPTAANPDFGIEAITFQDIIDDNPYEVSYDLDVFRISTTENIALSGKYNFGNLSLSSVTAYQITTEDRADEFDFSPADAQSTRSTIDFSNITQEFRLTTSDDKKFDWTLGVFGYRNNNLSNSINRFGPDLAAFGAPFDLLPLPIERPENSEIVQKGVAFYGQGDYELTDKLSLTLGLRYDLEESTADLFRAVSAFNPEPFELSVKADFNALSPKAALSYKANDDIFVYGSYARGFRPGGINSFVSEQAEAVFDPETTDNFELGIKTNWLDNKVKVNLTGFFINYKDQQLFTIVDFQQLLLGTDNIGKSRSYGIELESEFAVAKGLTLGVNAGYLNTEVLEYIAVFPGATPGAQTQEDFAGSELPLSPEFNFSSNATFIQPINPKINFEANLDYSYQTEVAFNIARTEENRQIQESYGILNGRIGLTSKSLDFFVWGKNITDVTYLSYGYGVSSFNAAAFGLPQTYGASVKVKF